MIIYELKLRGFYRFEDFEMDLTIPRSSVKSPILQEHKTYPNIKYKKFALLLGANASGKTTLGKTLCAIQNFVIGRSINTDLFRSLFEQSKSESKTMKWEVIFSVDEKMYYNSLEFNYQGIVKEEWKFIQMKNLRYKVLRKELLDTSNTFVYKGVDKFFSQAISDDNSPVNELNIGYQYTFSGSQENVDLSEVKSDDLYKIMHSFDNSIVSVTDSDDIEGYKVITFMNGHKEIIRSDGNLVSESFSILSTGTTESILLSNILASMRSNTRGTFYVDEKMSHVHSEIEQQIIQIMITLIDHIDGQVFITSHNSDLLDMKFPNYNFMLFKKNNDGTISKLIQPEKHIKHNDRSLKSIVEKDVFSTAPQLDDLIDLHDSLFDTDL